MVFIVVSVMIGFFWCATVGINDGLPNYIPTQNMGGIDFFYRAIRCVACLLFNTLNGGCILVGIVALILMYFFKQWMRNLYYKDYL